MFERGFEKGGRISFAVCPKKVNACFVGGMRRQFVDVFAVVFVAIRTLFLVS